MWIHQVSFLMIFWLINKLIISKSIMESITQKFNIKKYFLIIT